MDFGTDVALGDGDMLKRMNELLRSGLQNPDLAVFKNQARVIEAVLNGSNVLYIDGTGNGKSEAYFIAARLLRYGDPTYGPVVVIEPLNTLISNQRNRAIAFGLRAYAYNSSMTDMDKGDVRSSIKKNEVDLLFLTPEMISSFTGNQDHPICREIPQFSKGYHYVRRHKWNKIPLVVIDEIHYVSDVGHAFRPPYRQIWREIAQSPWYAGAVKLGMTATFNSRIEHDVRSLISFTSVIKGVFYRNNLAIRVVPVNNRHVKKVWLNDFVSESEERHVLVFCQSRESCEDVSSFLETNHRGKVDYYYAQRVNGSHILNLFMRGEIRILVATFESIGAGFNKTDIHDVVWMYTPSSIVTFYQGIGRAGRGAGIVEAKAYLLTSEPWRKDECLEMFVVIGNVLKDLGIASSVSDLYDRLKARYQPKNVEVTIDKAIEYGIEQQVFGEKVDGGKRYLFLTERSIELDIKEMYIRNRTTEVTEMSRLNRNLSCCWKIILGKLNGEEKGDSWTCGVCSHCQPDGDIKPDYSTAAEVCYVSRLGDVVMYALGCGGEVVSFNSSVIRDICFKFIPGVQDTPPEWAVSFIPDSLGNNEKKAYSIAESLNGLPVVDFITIDTCCAHLKMRDAQTDELKNEVLKKYKFDMSKLLGVRKLLIYDDCVNTGKTLNNAISKIQGFEVCVLVDRVYPSSDPHRTIETHALS